MAYSNKIVNSTPFPVALPWGRVKIHIGPDDNAELTVEQMDDFRPGKPGSEEVRQLLESYGVFLLDQDKGFDLQVLNTLEACIKHKEGLYRDFMQGVRNNRVNQGLDITEDTIQEILVQSGYKRTLEQIEILKDRVKTLKKALTDSGELTGGRYAPKLDPERTCFVTNPPRQFPTPLALKLFLDANPDIKAKHEDYLKQLEEVKPKKAGRPPKVEADDSES